MKPSRNIIKWTLVAICLVSFAYEAKAQKYHLTICRIDSVAQVIPSFDEVEGQYKDMSAIRLRLKQSLTEMRGAGFLAASYDSLRVAGDTVRAWLHSGRQYKWGKIQVTASNTLLKEEMPKDLNVQKNEVVNLHQLNVYQDRIVSFLEDRGYPFASVKLTNLENSGSDTLQASLSVNPGNHYVIDSILIKGEDPVSAKYLYPYLGLTPGMEYDESRIGTIPRKIENLPFLRQIRDFELEFSQGHRVNVFLYLERTESNLVDGVMGFLPEGNGKIRLTGAFDLGLTNLLRRGETMTLNWNSLEKESQELRLKADYPYLLWQSVGISASLELFKKDTSYLSRTFRAGMSFYVNSRSRLEIFADFEGSSLISKQSDVSDQYDAYSLTLYGLSYAFNNLDYRLNPSQGTELELFGSLGKRKSGAEEESLTSAEAGLDISYFQPLFGSWVLKTGGIGRFKYNWTETKPRFTENEFYRFGGLHSIRGFDDNAFLASAYSLGTLELRYLFSGNSNIHAFFDGGWYHKECLPGVKEDFPFGFGLGSHIDTGRGIIYFSYALGKQLSNPINFGSGKIHLGYVSKF